MNIKDAALKSLSMLDLTSLSHDDTKETIEKLCHDAINKHSNVASVCIYPEYIKFAKKFLKGSNIRITTVINFPNGDNNIETAVKEAKFARKEGANELDLVIPYKDFLNGNKEIVSEMVKAVRNEAPKNTLKVIIESGELKKALYINEVSKIAIDAGADFIKTSTGKTETSATLEAANAMLEAIKESGKNVGFKASGGIKTVEVAMEYLKLAKTIMGEDFLTKETFRFGASSLLNDILNVIEGKIEDKNEQENDKSSNEGVY